MNIFLFYFCSLRMHTVAYGRKAAVDLVLVRYPFRCWFLGNFVKLLKTTIRFLISVCLSVCLSIGSTVRLHRTTRLPLRGCSFNHLEITICDLVLEFIIPTFLIVQHASSDTSLITRSSKTVSVWRMQTRGCRYSFWAPDDERCVARNMLSNKKRWNNKF
jgi:hypothetical protein